MGATVFKRLAKRQVLQPAIRTGNQVEVRFTAGLHGSSPHEGEEKNRCNQSKIGSGTPDSPESANAVMRAIPGMQIFCPSDENELLAGLPAFLNSPGPAYIRFNASKSRGC